MECSPLRSILCGINNLGLWSGGVDFSLVDGLLGTNRVFSSHYLHYTLHKSIRLRK